MPDAPATASRRLQIMLGLGLAIGMLFTLGAVLLWRHFELPPLGEVAGPLRESILVWLTSIPLIVYILAFAILPAFGFPLSPFYLTVGVVVGHLGLGILTAWGCVAANIALAYWLTVGVAHPLIEWIVARRGISIPKINPRNQRKLTILVRLSPLPFGLQNFSLALGGVSFPLYMFWSVLIQIAMGTGVVYFGGSILQGNIGRALFGLFLIVATVMAISWWRRRNPTTSDELAA